MQEWYVWRKHGGRLYGKKFADSEWLTSVSKVMALENGILPWGKDER